MIKRVIDFLNEYLRINAVRRMLALVDVKNSEIAGLVSFAVVFAVFEGVGLSLLLPILQYAESGRTAIQDGSGLIWRTAAQVMEFLHLPVNLPVLLVMAFTPILMRQAVFYLNTWYSAVVSSRIAIRMRMQTLHTIFAADPEFFSRNPVGTVVGVVMGQTGAAGSAVLAVIKQLSIVLLMALYVAILLVISLPLTLIIIVFALVVSYTIRANIKHIREISMEGARIGQEMMGKIVERLGQIRLIKLRAQESAEAGRVELLSETTRVLGIRSARVGARIEVTSDPLLMLSVFVTLYIGITVLGMTLAQLGMLMFVLNRLNAKVKEFNAQRQAISANMAGLTLMQEMTSDAERSNTIRRGPVAFEGLKQEIEFRGVHFDYPDSYSSDGRLVSAGKSVLRGVDLTVPKGSFTALVGRSGGGKSTMVELLPRLRDVTSGAITIDGTDIREFDVATLRRGIGYLTQSPMLFNDTVRENLVYGLGYEPTEEQIRHAMEGAHATFVYDLPAGLETRLGDQGVRFSGGERQRIALARVLLQNTSLLILDEPTSALDSESEGFIQDALHKLHGKRTIIVIAHRLATVVQADQLLVVDQGRIIEQGTHTELVERDGAYKKLFESQLLA